MPLSNDGQVFGLLMPDISSDKIKHLKKRELSGITFGFLLQVAFWDTHAYMYA